jgi:hypothetical protein
MTLRERILARLALAEAAGRGGEWFSVEFLRWNDFLGTDARFIADRSPDRVIAECRADLALLDAYEDFHSAGWAVSPIGANLNARYPEGES